MGRDEGEEAGMWETGEGEVGKFGRKRGAARW